MKQILMVIFLALCSNISLAKDADFFISNNRLDDIYQIGSTLIDHYSDNIFNATSPGWFSKFESEIEINTYQVGIPFKYQGELGYLEIVKELNNFILVAEKGEFEKTSSRTDLFFRTAVGLVLLLERASYHHISKSIEIEKMKEGVFKRFGFNLVASGGMTKDPSKFYWIYLLGRYFHHPMDVVDQGINTLGLLSIKWKDKKEKRRSILNFMAGYAKFGIEQGNMNFLIFKSFENIKKTMPLRLLNTVLEFVPESNIQNNDQDIRLFALQEKYKIVKKYSIKTEELKTKNELLKIYKKSGIDKEEKFKIKMSGDISNKAYRLWAFMLGLLLFILRPIYSALRLKENLKNKIKIFFTAIGNSIVGKNSSFLGQVGLFIIIFNISLYFDEIKTYSPPLETFTINVK